MTPILLLLLIWSTVACIWWLAAIYLVHTGIHAPRPAADSVKFHSLLTIFKPLPRLGTAGASPALQRALASFVSQLDGSSEMLLGVHADDAGSLQPCLETLSVLALPGALRILTRADPDAHANPKIAWLAWLAPQARGDVWLWSDVDIVAPPGWIIQARAVFGQTTARLTTFPYYVRQPVHPQGWWDAAFVNAEMLPGAVLMAKTARPVDFAFGAAILFRREDFLARCHWAALGASLADDFALGQAMQPCRISLPALETLAEESTWLGALHHYQRWHKTVRWCQPAGYAAQLAILPLVGWLVFLMANPGSLPAWTGFLVQYLFEFIVIFAISRKTGAAVTARDSWPLLAWPGLRLLMWIASWLPFRVRWRQHAWSGLRNPD
jgi:ceramide glucosyltransferase